MALPAREVEKVFHEGIREQRLALPRRSAGKVRPRRIVFPSELAGKGEEPWWKVAPDIVRVTWRDGTIRVLLCLWPLE